jgi:hypothetical protein
MICLDTTMLAAVQRDMREPPDYPPPKPTPLTVLFGGKDSSAFFGLRPAPNQGRGYAVGREDDCTEILCGTFNQISFKPIDQDMTQSDFDIRIWSQAPKKKRGAKLGRSAEIRSRSGA